MSATAQAAGAGRTPTLGRILSTAARVPTPIRVLVVSRLVVLAAGVAGALAVPRRIGWWPADPTRITERLGAIGNLLAAPAVRWDSMHYLDIARHGYTNVASTVFYPLYPLLVRVLGTIVGSDPAAGVVISLTALVVGLMLLHRLTELELGRRAADVTVALVAFAPLSFFFSAVYTESLFLALSVGSVYAARRGRWKLACALGGLGAATRVTGVGLAIPLGFVYLKERRADLRLLWLLAVPAGLAGYLGFLALKGYGFLAPFTGESGVEYHRQMTGPLQSFVAAIKAAATGAHWVLVDGAPIYNPSIRGPLSTGAESVVLLAVLAIAIAALVAAIRRLPIYYGAYSMATLLVCTWSPVAGQPLVSFDRYVLTIFPLWMAVGAWLSERRLIRPALLVSAGLLVFWTFQFATWAWVA